MIRKHKSVDFYMSFNIIFITLITISLAVFSYFPNLLTSQIWLIITGVYFILLGYIGGFYLKVFPRVSVLNVLEIRRPYSLLLGIFLIILGVISVFIAINSIIS